MRFSRTNTNLQPETSPTNKSETQSLFLLREWIELEDEIGQGCFGQVFRGQLLRPDSFPATDSSYINVNSREAVAIKVLKAKPGISSTIAQEELLREAETMAAFSHENILALKGIVFNGKIIKIFSAEIPTLSEFLSESSLGPWIVFEYMALGDLAQLLRSTNDPVTAGHSYSFSLVMW